MKSMHFLLNLNIKVAFMTWIFGYIIQKSWGPSFSYFIKLSFHNTTNYFAHSTMNNQRIMDVHTMSLHTMCQKLLQLWQKFSLARLNPNKLL